MLWGPPFVAPIPVAAPNPLSLPDAAHLGAAGRHSFLPGGQRAGPWRAKAGPAHIKVESTGLLCFRAPRRQTLSPGWTTGAAMKQWSCAEPRFWEERCPCVRCEMHALLFPAPPPFPQKESTLSSWASFPGAEVSYSIFSLNEALLFWCEDLIASKVLLTPLMEANCAVRGNHVVLLSCWHGGRPHPVYLQGLWATSDWKTQGTPVKCEFHKHQFFSISGLHIIFEVYLTKKLHSSFIWSSDLTGYPAILSETLLQPFKSMNTQILWEYQRG